MCAKHWFGSINIKGSSSWPSYKWEVDLVVLVSLGGTTPHVNFENKHLGKTSLYMHISRQARCHGYPYRTTLCPRRKYSLGNPTKILSHLRVPEQGPVTAYQMPPEPQHFQRHGPLSQALLSGWTHSRAPCPSPKGSCKLLGIGCLITLADSCCPSPPLQIWGSEQQSSPHQLFGLEK